jgi:hypothetical protein
MVPEEYGGGWREGKQIMISSFSFCFFSFAFFYFIFSNSGGSCLLCCFLRRFYIQTFFQNNFLHVVFCNRVNSVCPGVIFSPTAQGEPLKRTT